MLKLLRTLILAACLTSPAAALDYSDYVKKDDYVFLYMQGVFEGFSWSDVRASRSGFRLWCPPDSLGLTGRQIIDIIDGYVRKNPALIDYPMEMVLTYAMEDAFPCK